MTRTRVNGLNFLSDVTYEELQALSSICSILNDPGEPATHHKNTHISNGCSAVLPIDFTPSKHTVIVGRGKEPKLNMGNKRLRELASEFLPQYSVATNKRTKSRIVSCIVQKVRNACPPEVEEPLSSMPRTACGTR
jgi:hypothetical protein